MHELVLPDDLDRSLRSALLTDAGRETLAVVFAGRGRHGRTHRGGYRLLGRDWWLATESDYRVHEAFHLEMDPVGMITSSGSTVIRRNPAVVATPGLMGSMPEP